ncbi:MAG TPA: hypothetical protein VGS10_15125 [Terracidiphilus sp.]|nr:hypothetical protein [Terracidiphilus sp.]
MSDEQLKKHAMEILQRELGEGGFARLLRVYRPGNDDYTRDRRTWQSGITVKQIVADIKKRREKSA